MPRTKRKVDRGQLVEAIQTAESLNSFANRNELASYIEGTDWAVQNRITKSVVLSRIEEFELNDVIKTPKGKRGRKGERLSLEQKTAMQSARGKKKVDGKWINELRRVTGTSYLPIIDKIEQGSKTAAIKAMCLACSGEQKKEIKHCTVITCPLWGFRPYK